MLLAILTGQRLEDIALARFKRGSDWDPAFSAFIQKNLIQSSHTPSLMASSYMFPNKRLGH